MLDSGTIALQNRGPIAFLASQMLSEDLIYEVIFFFYRNLLCIILEFGYYVIILNNLCS